MVKKSLVWIYRAALWMFGIIFIIFLLSAFFIQFIIFPNIDHYKDKIADFASSTTKQKILIGNIKADWKGINPHLSLLNIQIYDAQNRPALQLKNTDISFSWLSIPLLEPHLAELTVRSPELTIRRVANGDIYIAGISSRGESKPDLPNWLLRQSKLDILDAKIVWLDELRGANALSLNRLNLEIISPPWKSIVKQHRVKLSALPSIGTYNPVTFNGSLYGNDVSRIDQWHGSITMQLKNANVAAFKPWIDYPINLLSGVGSAELTIDFAQRQLKSIESDVDLENVVMQLKETAEPVLLNKLVGKLNWTNGTESKFLDFSQFTNKNKIETKHNNAVQSLSIQHLSLNTNNGLKLEDLSAKYSINSKLEQLLSLTIAHINLASINPYLSQFPVPENVLSSIKNLSPTGNLDQLTLSWAGKEWISKKYQINSKFNGLNINAQNKIPGFNNLSGEIKTNQNAGKLTLHSQNSLLDFKDVFRDPIPADKLDGEFTWNIKTNETKIQISQLNITNPHLSGTVSASYLMDGNKGGYLDLKGKLTHCNVKFAPMYYPISLNKDTTHWLETSIISGNAENINLIVKGRLDDFPFVDSKNNLDSKLGLFRVSAKISNGVINYGTDWPSIEGLGLDVLFEGKRMELNASSGHIYGNQLIKSRATIPQLDANFPILNIDGEIRGPVTEGIKFVNNSPVYKVTQGFTEDIKTSGSGKLNLSLQIPLDNVDSTKCKGIYQMSNGSLDETNIPTLTKINGNLEFTESSLNAKNINASAFGAPLLLNLSSGKDKTLRISAKGKLYDDAIKQIAINQNFAKLASYLNGSIDWLSEIVIQKPTVSIGIRADLFGLSSTFPAPLNKNVNEHLNLRIDKKQDAGTDIITVNISNRLGAKLMRSTENGKMQLDRLYIHFNTANPNNRSEYNNVTGNNNDQIMSKGLQISGGLDYIDADSWRIVLNDLSDNTKQDIPLPLQKVDLKINSLDIFNRRINQISLLNIPDKDGLRANIQSREITGELQWINQNNGKLIAHLSNLTIPEVISKDPKVSDKVLALKEYRKLKQDYPALDITADNFEFNNKNFGGLALIAYPENENWNIQKLKLISPEGTISADGQWNNWIRSPNTLLNVTWDIKNLGKSLKRIGYPDTILGGEGLLTGQLHWPGSPHEFDPIGLNGNLQFEVRKGQILKVQPGVGRLLGLLSLQSLPRRLTLDFRDLFSNGFAFDKINASVKIDRGIMRSDNFSMSGPAADVTIRGETNLNKETQQLFIKVMPHISDSLSLAALAGGPLAGAVAFLAQKILKDPLNKIASSEYEITGTWDNPQEVKATKKDEAPIKDSPLDSEH